MAKKQQAEAVVENGLTPLQQELLNRADSIMDSIASTVSKASTFASEQIPDIAIQYVAYGRAATTTFFLIGLALLCLSFFLVVRVAIFDKYKQGLCRSGYGWPDGRTGAMVVGLMSGVIGAIVFFVNLQQTLMVWFAPKVWLLNEIARLVKMAK